MRRRELICSLGTMALAKSLADAATCMGADNVLTPSTRSAGHPRPKTIAGIRLVDSRLAQAAGDFARGVSPPYLYNHAVRTFLFASLAGLAKGQKLDAEMLYLACILHDLGLTDKFQGDLPFEIQGAEAAKHFLEQNGYAAAKAGVVWDGIAMHACRSGNSSNPRLLWLVWVQGQMLLVRIFLKSAKARYAKSSRRTRV